MNKTSILSLLLVGTIGLSGCGKKFFELTPTGDFSNKQLQQASLWNTDILLGQIGGQTALMYKAGVGGTGGHQDFGQKTIDIFTDLMSADMEMYAVHYGHFGSLEDLTGTKANNGSNYGNWRYLYKVVFETNSFFNVNGSDEKANEQAADLALQKSFFGQAKVMRGFAYYQLANLYAKPYAEDKTAPCVPLRLKLEDEEMLAPSTVEEVYNQVIKDLETGYENLKEEKITLSGPKNAINADIALGYLAYAYLQTEQWQKAYDAATQLIATGRYPLMTAQQTYESGFNHYSNPEFIWSPDITSSNTGQLVTFWGHMDVFTYSYASVGDAKRINSKLYDEIRTDDIRKNWFLIDSTEHLKPERYKYIPYRKFFDAGRKEQGDKAWTNDIEYLRIAEMYLIAAETAARMDKLDDAKKYLNNLLDNRYNYLLHKDLPADQQQEAINTGIAESQKRINAMSKEQLLNEILHNWRVEMWGEGRALATKKRFHKDMERSASAKSFPGQTIKWDDPRLTFEIPQKEKENNINIPH